MPRKGGGAKKKGAKVRVMLMRNGDSHCTHLATFCGHLSVATVCAEAGQHLKGIAQTGVRRLYATDGYPLGDDELTSAVANDIVVVAMDEDFIPLTRSGEVGRKQLKLQGGQVYSADSGYSDKSPLGLDSRPPGWDAPVEIKVSSVAAAFGAKADRECYQPRLKIDGLDSVKKRVLVLESADMSEVDKWAQCLQSAVDVLRDASTTAAASSVATTIARADRVAKMQGRGELLGGQWYAGDVVDVDTEEGMQCDAVILGPSKDGDPDELRVRFADGDVDDWPFEDFRTPTSKNQAAEPAQPEPEQALIEFRPHEGWLGKRWDKSSGTADRRWFVLRPNALEYYKSPEDVKQGKGPKGRLPLENATLLPREQVKEFKKVRAEAKQGPVALVHSEFSQLSLKGLKKGQSVSFGPADPTMASGGSGGILEWQRLPKTLLDAHCSQKRRPKPIYENSKDYLKYLLPAQDGVLATVDGLHKGSSRPSAANKGAVCGCKLTLRDTKNSLRDLVFYARYQTTHA
jgi:hypothetical protein